MKTSWSLLGYRLPAMDTLTKTLPVDAAIS